ncbi:uncharacterized protein LOC116342277 [Contarinia nasturtii]|uniref:uncharacterized protein LOC116342277 n=1 Tax=Contarinia nasturtii TaxID=265458 RepID=UPI0012D373F1|nr:uncharacterized protein LOC116342277 [Contarinia nasturtii]
MYFGQKMKPIAISTLLIILAVALLAEAVPSGRKEPPNKHTTNIIFEGKLMYAYFRSNVTIRPIRLLIDTGAGMTMITSDVIKPNEINLKDGMKYWGLIPDAKKNTLGTTYGDLSFSGNATISAKIQIIDRKDSFFGDGILGFDTMQKHFVEIDFLSRQLIYWSNKKFNLIDFLFK